MKTELMEQFKERVQDDYEKIWDTYEISSRKDKQANIYEMYVIEGLLAFLEMGVIDDKDTIEELMSRKNLIRYLYTRFENENGLDLGEEEIKYFLMDLQEERKCEE